MPSSKGTNFTPVDREARLRHKLVNNEMNPFVDAILTVVLLCASPFIWMFAMVHDKLMFKFLNKTYIYNVSWEVRHAFTTCSQQLCLWIFCNNMHHCHSGLLCLY